jgi:hypothetical protein
LPLDALLVWSRFGLGSRLASRRQEEVRMPVFVRFNSGENLRLAENFDQVNRQLGEAGKTAGLFNTAADHPVRVVVFVANIEYIQELGEDVVST